MDTKTLRKKSAEELMAFLHETEVALGAARVALSANKLTRVRTVRVLRRTIARVQTLLQERTLL